MMTNYTPVLCALLRWRLALSSRFPRRMTPAQVLLGTTLLICFATALTQAQLTPSQTPSTPAPCRISVSSEFSLDCSYSATTSVPKSTPHLRLEEASISFGVKSENYMSLSLTIANDDTKRLEEQRPVFLVIDDIKGMNYLRRSLPHVDLGSLKPGETRTFSEKLLVGAFNSGEYVISLWIPSSNPGETYKIEQNFLLGGETVANETTRLNELAHFTVKRSFRRNPKPE
jgi:hypothetical protein